jgi:serine/threonine protein kinase
MQTTLLNTNHILKQGRYRIIGSFGHGEPYGMYEAYDTASDTKVVVSECVAELGKVAAPRQLAELDNAFADEAKILSEIRHDSLVGVQDYFSEIDRRYLVLESLTGHSLAKYLDPGSARPSTAEVLVWADQLLDGLRYLQSFQPPVTHRDISPMNIKLTSASKVKLLITRIGANPSSSLPSPGSGNDSPLTYKPLEQIWTDLDHVSQRVLLNSYDEPSAGILLRPLDGRCDIYSLAASLYHVLTGIVPLDALERSIAILDGKPDPLQRPTDIDATIPPNISDALMRALALRRENRFDSAVVMQQVFRTAADRVHERTSGSEKAGETVNDRAAHNVFGATDPSTVTIGPVEGQLDVRTNDVGLPREAQIRTEPVADRLVREAPKDTFFRAIGPDDDDDDLLELDPVSHSSSSFVQAVRKRTPEEMNPSGSTGNGFKWWIPGVVFAALAVIVGIVGVIKLSSTTETVPTAAVSQKLTAGEDEAPPKPELIAAPSPFPESTSTAADIPAAETPSVTLDRSADRPKRPQIASIQEKPQKPAQQKLPAEKKKLTVDDLINGK